LKLRSTEFRTTFKRANLEWEQGNIIGIVPPKEKIKPLALKRGRRKPESRQSDNHPSWGTRRLRDKPKQLASAIYLNHGCRGTTRARQRPPPFRGMSFIRLCIFETVCSCYQAGDAQELIPLNLSIG